MATHSTLDHTNIPGVPVQLPILAGAGVPDNGLGSNGNFYFRTDGTLLASLIYHKAGGVWVPLAIA